MELEELVPKESLTPDNWTEIERQLVVALAPIVVNIKKPSENKFWLIVTDETSTFITLQIWDNIDQLIDYSINFTEIKDRYFPNSRSFTMFIMDNKWLIHHLDNLI